MEDLLSEPIKTISANPWGAAWVITVILSALAIRGLWNEVKAVKAASDAALAKKDEQLQQERHDRINDLKSVERLQGSIENLGDKFLEIASRGRRA